MEEFVQPVTDFDELAKEFKVVSDTESITSATTFDILTCPEGKRRDVKFLHVYLSSGVYDFANLYYYNFGVGQCPVHLNATDVTEILTNFNGQVLVMNEKDYLRVLIANWTSIGNLGAAAIVEEQDAF